MTEPTPSVGTDGPLPPPPDARPPGRPTDPGPPRAPRKPVRRRRWLSRTLMVVATISLFLTSVLGWASSAVFDGDVFSKRAAQMLDSSEVRTALADRLADEITERGSTQLVAYRPVLVAVIQGVSQTEAFKAVVARALQSAHSAVFQEDGDKFVINLAGTLQVVLDSARVTNPDLAKQLPTNASDLLVDVTDKARSLQLWQVGETVDSFLVGLIVITLLAYVGAVYWAPKRRKAFLAVGFSIIGVAGALVVLTVIGPKLAAAPIKDPTLEVAIRAGLETFMGDLRSGAFWLAGYGVIMLAVVNAAADPGRRFEPRQILARLQARFGRPPASDGSRVLRGIGLVALGFVVLAFAADLLSLAILLLGVYVAYYGLVEIISVVGRPRTVPAGADAAAAAVPVGATAGEGAPGGGRRRLRLVPVVAVVAVITLLVTTGLIVSGRSARKAAAAEEACNGHVELCDRTIDKVAFAGSHNSMSAARERGWLMGEHLGGIPAQLRYGIRAFLIDTHYGVPTGLTIPGTNLPVIATDKAEEEAVAFSRGITLPSAQQFANEVGGDLQARAEALNKSAPKVADAERDVYLCHNYCELGATRFADSMKEVNRFLTANPREVVILFLEDYVTQAETQAALVEAGLFDRVYTRRPGDPFPTLRQMIDENRQVWVMGEMGGPPPDWYQQGFQVAQETPYKFKTVEDFSCAPNRGTPDDPMFLVNHWLDTGKPPTPDDGKAVNSYDVLSKRVKQCQAERGKFPNIIAVNWYDKGDVLRVVDELNGVR